MPSQRVARRASPPVADTSNTSQPACGRKRANAIWRPSGDHTGKRSEALAGVATNATGGVLPVLCIHKVERPSASFANTTSAPSGDNVGLVSNAALDVISRYGRAGLPTTRVPLASTSLVGAFGEARPHSSHAITNVLVNNTRPTTSNT
ncbi:hypothetical protein D3C81_1040110 [compost metagenome]